MSKVDVRLDEGRGNRWNTSPPTTTTTTQKNRERELESRDKENDENTNGNAISSSRPADNGNTPSITISSPFHLGIHISWDTATRTLDGHKQRRK